VSKSVTVSISNLLSVSLLTDKNSYNKGDLIILSGVATDVKGSLISSARALINFVSAGFVQSAIINVTNGLFNYNYPISFAVPDGNFNISVIVTDTYNNTGRLNKSLIITTPSAVQLQYNVQILSPAEGVIYKRGERIPVSVKILESGQSVSGANVSFIAPDGSRINLSPSTPGIYASNYFLKYSDPSGPWSLSVNAIKIDGNVTKAGGAYIPVLIEPANLSISILTPTTTAYTNNELLMQFRVMYPDGSLVSGAKLKAVSPSNQTIGLTEVSVGVYELSYTASTADEGVWSFNLAGTDDDLNVGLSERVELTIIQETIIQQFVKVLFGLWWVFAGGITIIIFAARPYVKKSLVKSKAALLNKEFKKIKKVMAAAENDYYHSGGMPRETFNDLKKKNESRLVEIKSELNDLKQKKVKRKRR
jgi:hypothetical protein